MKGYGQIFLLLLAIGLIFLATSGKGYAIYTILTGKSVGGTGTQPPVNPTDPKNWTPSSGSGGVRG